MKNTFFKNGSTGKNSTCVEQKNENVIDTSNGKFFDAMINIIDECFKGMEAPLGKLTLPREMVHRISHEDFGMSKLMLLEELIRRLNKKFNSRGLYAYWQFAEDGYLITIVHQSALTEAGKKHFGLIA